MGELKNETTNLGKIIKRREQMGVSQTAIAEALGKSRQAWSKTEKDYRDDPSLERDFTYSEMRKLNTLLQFKDVDIPLVETEEEMRAVNKALEGQESEILTDENDPVIFDAFTMSERCFHDALNRDQDFVLNLLACICEAKEDDLKLLECTLKSTMLAIDRPSNYMDDPSELLISVIKKNVVTTLKKEMLDRDAFQKIVQEQREKVSKETDKMMERIRSRDVGENPKTSGAEEGEDLKKLRKTAEEIEPARVVDYVVNALEGKLSSAVHSATHSIVKSYVMDKIDK